MFGGVIGREGVMQVVRCEILKMALLKLNMSNSTTITIKWKVWEVLSCTHQRVCEHTRKHTHFVLVKGKIAERAVCQRSSHGVTGLMKRDTIWMQSPIMRPQYCCDRLAQCAWISVDVWVRASSKLKFQIP